MALAHNWTQVEVSGNTKFNPTPEQSAIFEALCKGIDHIIVDALAGSGKTTSIIQMLIRWCSLPKNKDKKVLILAFNVHIIEHMRLQLKLNGLNNVECVSYNSLGFAACRKRKRKVEIVPDKLISHVFKSLAIEKLPSSGILVHHLEQISRLAKCMATKPSDVTQEWVDSMTKNYGIELADISRSRVPKLVERILSMCLAEETRLDFDDQLYMPTIKGYKFDQYDLTIIDEAQDTNDCQALMALQTVGKTGRLVVVGDTNQAIYSFRGSNPNSMNQWITHIQGLKTHRKMKRLSLSVSFRSPRKGIEYAQAIVPAIKFANKAIEGSITSMKAEQVLKWVKPGDMIIGRTNIPVIQFALELIRRGKLAKVRGRDIATGLTRTLGKYPASNPSAFIAELREWAKNEKSRLNWKADKDRINSIDDRLQTFEVLCEGLISMQQVYDRIDSLFGQMADGDTDDKYITLSTIHRAKGLECDRLVILKPEEIPHPKAKTEIEVQQEYNLAYIAITRFKKECVFVGAVPKIYFKPEFEKQKSAIKGSFSFESPFEFADEEELF
jgi:DNA helicase II / ATP-dependent DNA helicase PcrA